MNDPQTYENAPLIGGFTITGVEIVRGKLTDSFGRPAIAKTRIIGKKLSVIICAGLSDSEWSVTLYHEILEAMTVACEAPPESVLEFGEPDFEREAYAAHDRLGPALPANLNRMLQSFGFREK